MIHLNSFPQVGIRPPSRKFVATPLTGIATQQKRFKTSGTPGHEAQKYKSRYRLRIVASRLDFVTISVRKYRVFHWECYFIKTLKYKKTRYIMKIGTWCYAKHWNLLIFVSDCLFIPQTVSIHKVAEIKGGLVSIFQRSSVRYSPLRKLTETIENEIWMCFNNLPSSAAEAPPGSLPDG